MTPYPARGNTSILSRGQDHGQEQGENHGQDQDPAVDRQTENIIFPSYNVRAVKYDKLLNNFHQNDT